MSDAKTKSDAPTIASAFIYFAFVTSATFGLPQIPELSEKYGYIASAVFVLGFQAYCAMLMLLYERQTIPVTVAEDAAEVFAQTPQNSDLNNRAENNLNAA